MRKIKRVKGLVVSAILAGAAVGVPVVGFMPSAVMAAEADSIILNVKQSEGGVASSSASGSIKSGETFTLNARADEGYRFAYWNLKSDGYHEIVSGSETDASISVRVNESDSKLFTAEAVFIANDLHIVLNDGVTTFAKTGDKIDVSNDFSSSYYEDDKSVTYKSSGVGVSRLSDNEDVTEKVLDRNSLTITVPDYDISIFRYKSSSYAEKVLDVIDVEDDTFSIENATGEIAQLPETAKAGDEVEIITVQPDDAVVTASYRIERISDGADMTGMLMINEDQDRFIMPYYDIRIVADGINSGVTPEVSSDDENTSEEIYSGELTEESGEFQEKVLAEYYPSEEADDTEAVSENVEAGESKEVTEGSEQAAGVVSEVEAGVTAEVTENTEVSVRNDASVSENKSEFVKSGVVSSVAAPAAGSVQVAGRVQPAAGSTVAASPVYSPAAVRAEGANSTSISSVSAPATGDYDTTGAVTFAAIAAGAGIAAAGIMLKRRNAE